MTIDRPEQQVIEPAHCGLHLMIEDSMKRFLTSMLLVGTCEGRSDLDVLDTRQRTAQELVRSEVRLRNLSVSIPIARCARALGVYLGSA